MQNVFRTRTRWYIIANIKNLIVKILMNVPVYHVKTEVLVTILSMDTSADVL